MTIPYQLINDPETGLYYFTTDAGVSYVCRFRNCTSSLSPMIGIYDIEIYEFEFYKNGIAAKSDPRVGYTITMLLQSFFIHPNRVIVYICDASDRKDRGRARLFQGWHSTYLAGITRKAPIEINLEDETGIITTIYGGALMRHDFPHYHVLHDEVLINAHDILNSKYDI